MQPVAPKRCARVLAGRLLATHLPARTRAHRWLHLIFKDHYSSLRGFSKEKKMEATAKPEIKGHDKLYINGQWINPKGAGMIDVINAQTEELMGQVPAAAPENVNAAVAAAKAAFEKWSTTSSEERERYLQLISDRLNMRKDEIAALVASEVGMPLPLATAVQAGMPAAVMGSYAKLLGEFKFEEQIGNAAVVKEPVGV